VEPRRELFLYSRIQPDRLRTAGNDITGGYPPTAVFLTPKPFPRNGVSRDCLLENLRPREIRVASPPSRLVPSCSAEFGPRIGDRLNAQAGEGLSRERLSLRYEPALASGSVQGYTNVLPRGARQCCEAGLRVTSATPVSLVARELGAVFLFSVAPPLAPPTPTCASVCALRQRYTMPCCPQAATPASARTVWGYEMIRGSSSSSASSSSFKNDVIRTRLLVWRARRLISR
jgi:hypothetical protein